MCYIDHPRLISLNTNLLIKSMLGFNFAPGTMVVDNGVLKIKDGNSYE